MCHLIKLNTGRELIFSSVHYCGNLWNPNYWVLLDRLKCATPSGKAQNVFANDIQRLYDIANRLASLEQTKSQLDNFYGRSSICC